MSDSFVTYNPGTMVDVIDVTLFKYNHYDNLIWTKCLNQVDYMPVREDEIIINPYQLQMLLDVNFERELNRLKSVNFDLVHKDASSLFFLIKMLEDFENLKWIKLSLNRKRHFSRMVEDYSGSTRQIKYSFKILKMTARLSHMLPIDVVRSLNKILKKVSLVDMQKPYHTIRLKTVVIALEAALNTVDMNDEQAEALSHILDCFDSKMEGDNPEVLFVTDW